MPRMARIAPGGHVFHVLTRGNNRQDVFLDTEDYQTYMEILNTYKKKFEGKVYHYVLMTNHVHLVLETLAEGGSLAEVMKVSTFPMLNSIREGIIISAISGRTVSKVS